MARESFIRVLRSTSTDVPTGLTFGELAYSDLNGKFFVGDSSGSSLWIGAEVTSGDLSNNSAYMVSTQSSVKAYVDGIVGGGSVVNSVNGTGGAITITGSGAVTTTVSGTTTTFGARLATTSVTGVASFSSDNFAVSAGGQVTIKNGGVANDELVNSSITTIDNSGNQQTVNLGGHINLTGSSGVSITQTSPYTPGSSQLVLANTGVLSVNGSTGNYGLPIASTAATGVASFHGDYFSVNGLGRVSLATAYQATGDTVSAGSFIGVTRSGNSVTVNNIGVHSVNGVTGAYTVPVASTSVTGFASFSSDNFAVSAAGAVTIKDGGVANAELVNSSVTITAGTGLAGGGAVALGSSVSLSNNGVLSFNGVTGAVTYSPVIASTSLTGVASFSTSNFAVSAGGEVTIKDRGVANAEIFNPFILAQINTGVTGDVQLGETLTITGSQGIGMSLTKGSGSSITLANTGVLSVNGATGAYTVPVASTSVTGFASFSSDNFAVSAAGAVTIKDGGVANAELANSSVTITAGTGLAGGGAVALGSSVSLSNNGVLSFNGATGAVGFSNYVSSFNGVTGAVTYSPVVASTSLTGVASFSSDNFAVSAGGAVTIKDGGVANAELVNSSINVSDGSSSSAVALGGTLTITGSANEILVSQSSGTVTIGLPDDVIISGNLTVNGSVVTANVDTIVVEDPLIMLGTGNAADSVDLGFYGKFTSGAAKFGGLFRDASDGGKYKLFTDLEVEPTTTVNTAGTGYAVGTLVANIDGGTF